VLSTSIIGIAAAHAGTAQVLYSHQSRHSIDPVRDRILILNVIDNCTVVDLVLSTLMIEIAAVLMAYAGAVFAGVLVADSTAVDPSIADAVGPPVVVDSSMSVVAMDVFGEPGLTYDAVGAEGLTAQCMIERIDDLARMTAEEGLAAVSGVLFASAMVVFVLMMMLRDVAVAIVKLVLLHIVLLHIVSLAVRSSLGIPRIMEIFVLAIPLRLPVLVVVISMPYLICHCSLFCASAERRYCLVLWPAEGHHCSTCVPAHLRVAEGCCLSAESDLTDHLVCVCLRSFEEFRMGSMFVEVLYVRHCSRVSLTVEMEVRIGEGDLLYC
jgi:hypothetical protein